MGSVIGANDAVERQRIYIFASQFYPCDPASRMKIAQPPFPFLDFRFQEINRSAVTLMPDTILLQFLTNKSVGSLLGQARFDACFEIAIKRVVAAKKPRIQEGGFHFHVAFGQAHTLGRAARRMPDLESGVP